MKKILVTLLTGALLFSLVGCGDSFKEGVKDGMEASKTEEKQEEKTEVNIDKLDTKEDVDNAYNSIMDKITNKEAIRELDYKNIKLDNVKEYANNADLVKPFAFAKISKSFNISFLIFNVVFIFSTF